MFQVGYVHLPKSEPLRIEGGPRASDGYDPTPRSIAASPEQLEKLRSATTAAAPQPKRKSAGQFEAVVLSSGDKAQIVERYKAGENMVKLAMSYNVPSIREILVSAGVEIRPVGFQPRGEEETQPAPDLPASIQEDRSKDMPKAKRELSPEDKHIICNRYQKGKSVKELANQFHVGLPRIREVLAEGGVETRKRGFNLATAEDTIVAPALHPGHEIAIEVMRDNGFDDGEIAQAIEADHQLKLIKATDSSTLVDTDPAPPSPQMDDPELAAAAQDLARSRARELHGMVIAVQELDSPVLARKQYDVPRILESGTLFEMANPHAAAKMVEGLVAKLNQVPGFQAYFEWRTEGRTGQPLAR